MTDVHQRPGNGAYGPLPRKEDARFIRGKGRFVDDIQLPGMLYGAVLRSPWRTPGSCPWTPPTRWPIPRSRP